MSYTENMISNLGYCESLNYKELSSNNNCMDILKKYCNLGYNIFDNACLNYTNAYVYANTNPQVNTSASIPSSIVYRNDLTKYSDFVSKDSIVNKDLENNLIAKCSMIKNTKCKCIENIAKNPDANHYLSCNPSTGCNNPSTAYVPLSVRHTEPCPKCVVDISDNQFEGNFSITVNQACDNAQCDVDTDCLKGTKCINNKCVVPGSTPPTKTPEPDNKTQIKVNTLDTQTIIFVIGGCLMGILILFSIVR